MAIIEVSTQGGIAEVLLNRPDKKNALSEAMFAELPAAAERLKAESGLRAVILCGAGGDFCAGLDMGFMGEMAGRMDEMRAKLLEPSAAGNWFQRPSVVWQELGVPVIAAIEGVCLGGGLQIALGADVRIARGDARLSIMEAKWGMIPDMGISQSLPKLMRADQAKRLMMTAQIVSGAEALAQGLVTELAEDPLAAARELAKALAAKSPDALAGIKRMVEQTWDMPPLEGLRVEAQIQAPIIGGPNQMEAVFANMQKRAPKFR